jgi:hypothetical protein
VNAANNDVVASQRQRPRAIRKQEGRLRNDFRNGIGGKSISCARSGNAIARMCLQMVMAVALARTAVREMTKTLPQN